MPQLRHFGTTPVVNQPIVFRTSLSIAAVRLLQFLMPPLVAALLLVVIAAIQDVPFNRLLLALMILTGALSSIVIRPDDAATVPMVRPLATAFSLLARWLMMLGILLAVGYVTGFSDEFPRRAILPWAVLTPIALVLVSLALSALMRSVVLSGEFADRRCCRTQLVELVAREQAT